MKRRTRKFSGGGKRPSRASIPLRPKAIVDRLLDRFSAQDVDAWASQSRDNIEYANAVYYDLERQRTARYDDLLQSLRSVGGISVPLDPPWVRITDYEWCLKPLSPAGSLKLIGGRFNFGAQVGMYTSPFPAIYIASDVATGQRERFGATPKTSALNLNELALRKPASHSIFYLSGEVHNVFDLSNHKGLEEFVSIISEFTLSKETLALQRKLNCPYGVNLVRTAKQLLEYVLLPPDDWRLIPTILNTPAPSQILAKYIVAAGFTGIRYPSQRGGGPCLAVFPQNVQGDTVIKVIGPFPPQATFTRLDSTNVYIAEPTTTSLH